MVEKQVLVVILNWNNWEETISCITSVLESSFKNCHVVLVDNNSTDDSVEQIKNKFPNLDILINSANLGYAGGNNTGLKKYLHSDYDFAFIVNNDCILHIDCIRKLVDYYESLSEVDKIGFLGPLVFSSSINDKTANVQFSGSYWSESSVSYKFSKDILQDNTPIECPVVLGCSLFCSFELLREIGIFDERFFLLWEETDICLRAITKGYKNFCIPDAMIFHIGGSSFKKLSTKREAFWNYFYRRNQLLWIEKHFTTSEKMSYYKTLLLQESISALKTFLSLRSEEKSRLMASARLQAYLDYITRQFGDCPSWLRD